MSDLEYQVNSSGQIVSIKTIDGQSEYTVGSRTVKNIIGFSGGRKDGRHNQIKRLIATQPVDEWKAYFGFPDVTELRRASLMVYRCKKGKDGFFNSIIDLSHGEKDWTMQVKTSRINKEIGVKITLK